MVSSRIVALGALSLLAACDSRTYDRMYGGQLGEAREAVRAELKDPDSAKFAEMEVCKANKQIVSGKVNGKNGFGAYTGDDHFYVSGSYVQFYRNVLYDDFARKCYGSDPIWQDYLKTLPPDIDRLQSSGGGLSGI